MKQRYYSVLDAGDYIRLDLNLDNKSRIAYIICDFLAISAFKAQKLFIGWVIYMHKVVCTYGLVNLKADMDHYHHQFFFSTTKPGARVTQTLLVSL